VALFLELTVETRLFFAQYFLLNKPTFFGVKMKAGRDWSVGVK